MRPLPALVATLSPVLLSGVAPAQHATELLSAGELTDNNGAVTGITDFVNSEDEWVDAICRTDHPDRARQQAYRHLWMWRIEPGHDKFYPYWCITAIRDIEPSWMFLLDVADPDTGKPETWVTGDYGHGYVHQLDTGGDATELGFPAETRYAAFHRLRGAAGRRFVLRGEVSVPDEGERAFLSRGNLDGGGYPEKHLLVASQGGKAPKLDATVTEFFLHDRGVALNDFGRYAWTALVEGPAGLRSVAYVRKQPVALEGGPSPAGDRRWGRFTKPRLDLNGTKSWSLVARLDSSDPATAPVIVVDGVPFQQAGDVPASVAPHALAEFGGFADLSDQGDVVWHGRLDGDDPATDECIFLEDTVVLREGMSEIQGERVVSFGARPRYSWDGRYLAVVVTLAGGREVLFALDLWVGNPGICPGMDNSTGERARVRVKSSNVLADGILSAQVYQLPPERPAVLLASNVHQEVPLHGGTLCLGTSPLRLAAGISRPSGLFTADVDLDALQAAGLVLAGESLYLQAVHSDVEGGAVVPRLSNAIRVLLK